MDLIIGAADNYTWQQVKPWAKSIRQTGFDGEVVLIVYRVPNELIEQCEANGVIVVEATSDDFIQPINHNKMGLATQAHQLRNFHMWQFLRTEETDYRYVIVTDTRDIYFQTNPSQWLDRMFDEEYDIMLPSEAILFEKEDWNAKMVKDAFGPYLWEYVLRDKPACNSGTFVGKRKAMQEMLLTMYLVAKNIGMSGIDQGTLNVLGHTAFRDRTYVCGMNLGWACQCGTVLDPTKAYLWERLYEPQPKIIDHVVLNSMNNPFVIVHQWDRVPELRQLVEARYA